MSEPTTKAEFRQRFDESWQRLESTLAAWDPEQMTVPADAKGWNVRDHVGHLCAWEASMIAFLQKEHEWDGCGLSEQDFKDADIDASNEKLREMIRNVSPQETLDMLRETNDAFLAALDAISEEEFRSPAREFHPDWREKDAKHTVVSVIASDSYRHFDEHLPWIVAIVKG